MKKNSNQSEAIVLEMMKIKEELDCDVFGAAIKFCSVNGIDIEDFIESLDTFTIDILRKSAIEQHMIRRKYVGVIHELPLVEGDIVV